MKTIKLFLTRSIAVAAIAGSMLVASQPAVAGDEVLNRPAQYNAKVFQTNLQRFVSSFPRTGLKTKFEFSVKVNKFGEIESISQTNDGKVDAETVQKLEDITKKTIEKTPFFPRVTEGETVSSTVIIPVTFVL